MGGVKDERGREDKRFRFLSAEPIGLVVFLRSFVGDLGRRRRKETQVEHQLRRRHKGGVSGGGQAQALAEL